jgi:adenosylhomocysteinase
MRVLQAGGADVVLTASNPLSTQDDVAATLVAHYEMPVYAIKGEDNATYYQHIKAALDHKPHITMDDGADLVGTLHKERRELLDGIIGGTEETTTGVIRLRAMAHDGELMFPVIAVNDALTKHLFDNRYGTGQSTIDGVIRATNVLIAGKKVVVAGYGWCSRGIAMRAGHGRQRHRHRDRPAEGARGGHGRLPRHADGEAAPIGDIFITATGDINVIDKPPLRGDEETAPSWRTPATSTSRSTSRRWRRWPVEVRRVREFLDEYILADGRRLYLAGEGAWSTWPPPKGTRARSWT